MFMIHFSKPRESHFPITKNSISPKARTWRQSVFFNCLAYLALLSVVFVISCNDNNNANDSKDSPYKCTDICFQTCFQTCSGSRKALAVNRINEPYESGKLVQGVTRAAVDIVKVNSNQMVRLQNFIYVDGFDLSEGGDVALTLPPDVVKKIRHSLPSLTGLPDLGAKSGDKVLLVLRNSTEQKIANIDDWKGVGNQVGVRIPKSGKEGETEFTEDDDWPKKTFDVLVPASDSEPYSAFILLEVVDRDGDGVRDADDNCDDTPNSDQSDLDGDGEGDACDSDDDGDGVADKSDDCNEPTAEKNWLSVNDGDVVTTTDRDEDGCRDGTTEDPNSDKDYWPDDSDNCPNDSNSDQSDLDGDGEGDACDGDDDGDGVSDESDDCDGPTAEKNWPSVNNGDMPTTTDRDEDGCKDGTPEDPNSDKDYWPDDSDNCNAISHPDQSDLDDDGEGDVCDSDDDGDGVPDESDDCDGPTAETNWNSKQGWVDEDGTDLTEAISHDASGFPVRGGIRILDYNRDGCQDDSNEDTDDDSDGIDDDFDNCPTGQIGWRSDRANDYDNDGCLDDDTTASDGITPLAEEDFDDDNDGTLDAAETTCLKGNRNWNSNQGWVDEDGADLTEAISHDASGFPVRGRIRILDYDRDGCQDDSYEDTDDDNDGKPDEYDSCPTGRTGWTTTDPLTDHDSDGCLDDTITIGGVDILAEDDDDDNDNRYDNDDQCPKGKLDWDSNEGLLDANGHVLDEDSPELREAISYTDGLRVRNGDIILDFDRDGCHYDLEDVDDDNDGLIELFKAEHLHNMRYDVKGESYDDEADDSVSDDVSHAGDSRGAPIAPTADCTSGRDHDGDSNTPSIYLCGYELMKDLDFAKATDYASGSFNYAWRPATTPNPTDDSTLSTNPSTAVNTGFPGIGATETNDGFAAIFDGNDKTISSLYMRNTESEGKTLGLFIKTEAGAKIRDVTIENAHLYGDDGNDKLGVLVGENNGTVTASSATGGAIEGDGGSDKVGGLVGSNAASSKIIASYATGAVDGGAGNNDDVGGLVGSNSGTVLASYATGAANGGAGTGDEVGGLVGHNQTNASKIIATYATGDANGDGDGSDKVGGLVGKNAGSITASYALGAANAGDDTSDGAGRLIGDGTTITIEESYGFGTVTVSGAATENTFGAPPNTVCDDGGGGDPCDITDANELTLAKAGTKWNDEASHTEGAWTFGPGITYPPRLKYADYDGEGSGTDYCADFPSCDAGEQESTILDQAHDEDGDYWPDAVEIACGTDKSDSGSTPTDTDTDGDRICDPLDADDDNDGVLDLGTDPYDDNDDDNCRTVANGASQASTPGVGNQTDTDGDGAGDACDDDDDGDGRNDLGADGRAGGSGVNADDNCRTVANGASQASTPGVGNQTDTDGDGDGDACDVDDDGDGRNDLGADNAVGGTGVNADDNCRTVANGASQASIVGVGNQTDTDGDGDGDACDTDDDDDGVLDLGADIGDDNDDDNCRTVANGASQASML